MTRLRWLALSLLGPLLLAADERARLEAALRQIYGLEVGALTALRTSGCPNE